MVPLCQTNHLSRDSIRAWTIAFGTALVLYYATSAPGLLWGDSGEAQLYLILDGWYVHGEIARSHVLYYAIARFFLGILPIDPTRVATLVSVVAGALTVANATWLFCRICRRRLAVVVAATMLALSHTLWQLSASAEVVTVSTALFTAELICLVKLLDTRRLRWLVILAFFNGLGAANHNFALLMWPVYFVTAWRFRSEWQPIRVKAIALSSTALLLGMLPVIALCVGDFREHGDIFRTLQSLLVGHYGPRVFQFERTPVLALRAIGAILLNFPTPLLVFAISGAALVRRSFDKRLRWILLGATIVYTAFGASYDVSDQHTFLIHTFILLTTFVACGLDSWLERPRGRFATPLVLALVCLAPCVYALSPPVLRSSAPNLVPLPTREIPYRDRYDWFLRPWRNGQTGAERYARETLNALPYGAWLVVDATQCTPLNYLQVARGLRRDVRLDSWLAQQDWFDPIDPQDRNAKLQADLLFAGSNEAAYLPDWLEEQGYRFDPTGHVFRVRRDE